MIHLHAATGPCRTKCGKPCDKVEVEYLERSRANCPDCLKEK